MWKCHYHSEDSLQNFCCNKECSLPLCPKCIHVHLHDTEKTHHILSLEDAIVMTKQQVQTCLNGLQKECEAIDEEYTPAKVMAEYRQVLEKYRKENIEQINRHYESLQTQINGYFKSLYSKGLMKAKEHLEEKLNHFRDLSASLLQSNLVIKTLISTNCNADIEYMENFFKTLRQIKADYTALFPRLELGTHGKLVLAKAQNPDLKQDSDRQRAKTILKGSQRLSDDSLMEVNRLERIADLQNYLLSLRDSEHKI